MDWLDFSVKNNKRTLPFASREFLILFLMKAGGDSSGWWRIFIWKTNSLPAAHSCVETVPGSVSGEPGPLSPPHWPGSSQNKCPVEIHLSHRHHTYSELSQHWLQLTEWSVKFSEKIYYSSNFPPTVRQRYVRVQHLTFYDHYLYFNLQYFAAKYEALCFTGVYIRNKLREIRDNI